MAQTTFEHLFTAIEECLTDAATGKARALSASQVFGLGYPPGVEPELRSVRCREHANKKAVFIALESQDVPLESVADELGSDHLYECSFVISRDYHLGYEFSVDEVRATMVRVADDFALVRKTLCEPSALDATLASTATGIAHGGLRAAGAKSSIRLERVGDGRDRLLNAIDRFTAAFLFTPGS